MFPVTTNVERDRENSSGAGDIGTAEFIGVDELALCGLIGPFRASSVNFEEFVISA